MDIFKREWMNPWQLVVMFVALGFMSCHHDDEIEKTPVYNTHAEVKFAFNSNLASIDKFGEEVKSVSLYVFDKNGIFVKVYEESGEKLSKKDYTLSVDGLAPGKYSGIAWCGLKDINDKKGGFTVTKMKAGVSPREEMLCRMNVKASGGEAISDTDLNNLFYGSLIEFTISDDGVETPPIYNIGLIQDTKEISITIQDVAGLKSLNAEDFIIRYEDRNGILGWDNDPMGSETVTYFPYSIDEIQLDEDSPKFVEAKMKVNRLMVGSTNTLTLYLKDKPNEAIARIPLVDYILRESNGSSFPEAGEITSQDILDRTTAIRIAIFLNK